MLCNTSLDDTNWQDCKRQVETCLAWYDMKWYNCIKSHHKGLGQVKTCFKIEKEMEKKKWKEKD